MARYLSWLEPCTIMPRWRFNSRSGYIEESINECLDQWSNRWMQQIRWMFFPLSRSLFPSLPLLSPSLPSPPPLSKNQFIKSHLGNFEYHSPFIIVPSAQIVRSKHVLLSLKARRSYLPWHVQLGLDQYCSRNSPALWSWISFFISWCFTSFNCKMAGIELDDFWSSISKVLWIPTIVLSC